MNTKSKIRSISKELATKYGEIGTPEREAFNEEAYAFCYSQILLQSRKEEGITQSELAKRIGKDKSYIAKIEKGIIQPSVVTFFKIIEALGLSVNIGKQL